MQRRETWAVIGVVAIMTSGVTAWSYYYSPSLTICDLTVEFDEGLLAVNVPLVPIAPGETPRSQFLLYHRDKGWRAGESGRMPWRNLPKVESFAKDSVFVGGFGYWLGHWQSTVRPGRFLVLFVPLWSVAAIGLLAYFGLRTRYLRLRLWMFFAFTAISAICLAWLVRRASGES